ncbi:maleylpyruvate isomerase family mycothiol-dependent enzyme [soil metagenome]
METTEAYRRVRVRMTGLLRGLDEADASLPVPACPAWTVQQLAAHAVGVSADILAGNTGAAGSDPWTEAQVVAREGRTLVELADEWDRTGPEVEAKLVGLLPAQAVFDQVTHEHDLRSAIGEPGAQDCPAVALGLTFVEQAWPFVMGSYDIPPIRIVTGGADLVVGEDPEVTLHLTPFEALRALTGRRSLDQVAAYAWGTDPTPWLPAFTWGPFTPSAVDLVEVDLTT